MKSRSWDVLPLGCFSSSSNLPALAGSGSVYKYWFEIDWNFFCFPDKDEKHNGWVPLNKGGEYRKWYGNLYEVVDWKNNAERLRSYPAALIKNEEFYFLPAITWSSITSGTLSFRYSGVGFIFDQASNGVFPKTLSYYYLIGVLNSKVIPVILNIINPSLNVLVGDIAKIPIIESIEMKEVVIQISKANICFSKADWDSFETSWDFQRHPLIALLEKTTFKNIGVLSYRVEDAFFWWNNECNVRFAQLKTNEEELNRIFIDIYGLQDELTPEVEDNDVTVRKADLQRDIKSLLSYAVGCMFGRYSLDASGLAYAGGEWDDGKYSTFIPDKDNVIPITDEEYLEDDIVGLLCAWLKKVYGAETLEENLDFIAAALGNKGGTSREIIRKYFLNDFMKDHIKVYQKRPIYWLFDSGKQNGFKALIYLHRYTPDTIGNLRIDYLHRIQRIYESEINRMQDMIDHSTNSREVATATKRKEKLQKQLKECREYDEKIAHLALSRIELDLDDGVKVNYEKVQTASDGMKYQVLAKI